jgi:hypothetical protein
LGGELLGNLSAYRSELKNELQKLPIDKAIIEELGDFGIKTEQERRMMEEPDLHWNGQLFDHQVIACALALLTGTQNEVLNAEFKCLKLISTKK